MTPKLPACTPKRVERVLRQLRFVVDRQTGSHRIFLHPTDNRRVVLPIHNRDLKAGLLHRTIKDIGVTPRQFRALLLGKDKRHPGFIYF